MPRPTRHHVTAAMMHPDLRPLGVAIRAVFPAFTPRAFAFAWKARPLLRLQRAAGLRKEQHYVLRPDGSMLRLCVYTPKVRRDNVPGLLWLHGGGYALGTPEQDASFIKRFVDASGCVVVSPDYRLTLEAPYPAAFDDCYQGLLWLKDHGERFGMRSDQIMVGGDSAGGGLAAAVALKARDTADVAVAFQMPLYPMLDDRQDTPSAIDNDAPIWNTASNRLAWRLYLEGKAGDDAVSPYAAPARATDLTGLPETCTFVGGIDPFRDETLAYLTALRAAGVTVHAEVFPGCFHSFDFMGAYSRPAKRANRFLMDTFRHAVEHCFAPQR
jgi:acetyl esterase/lipase